MRNFQTVLLVMLSLFLVSCFENETKVSSKQNVQDVMEQRQNMAATYARSLQLHAAATVDVLLDQASIQGDHVSNLSETGTIAGLLESGLIDSQAFAALDAGGDGALNTGRQRNLMQSGYCDGVLYTWVAGRVNDNGAVERPRLKGLGEAGLGSVAQVLSQHVGSNSYGMYKNNQLTTPSGVNVAIQCREMAAMIPAGSPVLFQEMASEFELARNGSYYEFENRACANADEDGFDRYRRLVTVAYNNQGDETGRETEEWELFLESCHNMEAAERISVNLSSSTADQIDFSAQNLDGGSTRSVVCFEANTTKKDAEGEKKDVEQGTSFNNCQSATEFETSLADDIDVECSEDVVRTEEDTRACTGDGWTGTVTYEREIVMCTKNGNGNSIDYEKRGEWERTAVDCSKDEVATASCPFGAGLVSYNRTNKITNPETLAPTNPSWNYTGDNCVTGEISCIGGYAGNGVAFASTANGASNPPVPETTSLNTYCGSGSICEEQRSVSCDVGNKTQRRQYLCNGGWTAWGDHETADCDPGENLVCRYNRNGPNDFVSRHFDFDQSCTFETDFGISYFWDSVLVYEAENRMVTSAEENGGYYVGELVEHRRTGSNGCDSEAYYEICREQICEPETLDQEQAACDSGYYGNKTRTRMCNEDGTEYGDWSAWNTSSCQAIICSPGATDSQSQSCPSGYNGQATRTRTCNATGTGYGAWSAWDNSSCTSDGSMVCTYSQNVDSVSVTEQVTDQNGDPMVDDECEIIYRKSGQGRVYTATINCGMPQSSFPGAAETGGYSAGTHQQTISNGAYKNQTMTYYYEICEEAGCSKRDKLIELLYGDQSEPVCTPNAVESGTSACGSGYSGDQTRTRTCNGDGSAWGAWSSWNRSSCTANVAGDWTFEVGGNNYYYLPKDKSLNHGGNACEAGYRGSGYYNGSYDIPNYSESNVADHLTGSTITPLSYPDLFNGHSVIAMFNEQESGVDRDDGRCDNDDDSCHLFIVVDGIADNSGWLGIDFDSDGAIDYYRTDPRFSHSYNNGYTIWEYEGRDDDECSRFRSTSMISFIRETCTPNEVETQSASCGSGYTGNKSRTRTCNTMGTGYSSWSAWDTSNCVEESETSLCTSYTFTYPENYDNYYDGSLGAGYMSNRGKGSISPASDFRGYSISAVKDTEHTTSDYQATGYGNYITIQIEGDVRSQIDSIKYSSGLGGGFSHMHNRDLSGNVMYGGGKTYYYIQNTSYTMPGFDGSGSGVIEICGFPVCTPNSVQTETRNNGSCPEGFWGSESRSRTCNASGSGYGSWSSWSAEQCERICPWQDPDTRIWYMCE